jgi:hypothetical protein
VSVKKVSVEKRFVAPTSKLDAKIVLSGSPSCKIAR